MWKKINLAVPLMMLLLALPAASMAGEHAKRWASGVVVATETTAEPNTIVISTKNWKGARMLVGADVGSGATIRKGGEKVPLAKVKAGDHVEMVYTRDGTLTALSIKVK